MLVVCFFQAEDGIRDLVRSRGLGDVYKRQASGAAALTALALGFLVSPMLVAIIAAYLLLTASLSLIHI